MGGTTGQPLVGTLPKKMMLAVTLVAAVVLATLTPVGVAEAGVDDITFCHATNSATNPYLKITTDPASIIRRGHGGHEGPIFADGMTSGSHWGDIIPPFDYVDKDGDPQTFPGLNWTAAGEALCLGGGINPEAMITVDKTAIGTFGRAHSWDLTKKVDGLSAKTVSGSPGDSFPVVWQVDADKTTTDSDYLVTGTIDITYSSDTELDFSVADVLDDGTVATVTCPTYVIPEGSDVINCTYTASPTSASATLNTATVTLENPPSNLELDTLSDLEDTAAVTFTPTVTGDDSVTLADPRHSYSQVISADTAPTFNETFSCPTTRSSYNADRLYSQTFTNTATLTGAATNLSRSATVTVNCEWELVFAGDSVTGAGLSWSSVKGKPATWFQYTNATSGTRNLVQGSKLNVVGSVTITPDGAGTTTLAFTMATGWELADVASNVKVDSLNAQPKSYVQPGQFKHHFKRSGSSFEVEVPTGSYGYAIHLDAGRWVEKKY